MLFLDQLELFKIPRMKNISSFWSGQMILKSFAVDTRHMSYFWISTFDHFLVSYVSSAYIRCVFFSQKFLSLRVLCNKMISYLNIKTI